MWQSPDNNRSRCASHFLYVADLKMQCDHCHTIGNVHRIEGIVARDRASQDWRSSVASVDMIIGHAASKCVHLAIE